MTQKMLILRGINNLLHEQPALNYAARRGYIGRVLDVSGEASVGSAQVRKALRALREDGEIAALYGFSGGGYNVRHILNALDPSERQRIKLVVVIGAPANPPERYRHQDGPWELVYHKDPDPRGHMYGPDWLLAQWDRDHPPVVATTQVQPAAEDGEDDNPPPHRTLAGSVLDAVGRALAALWPRRKAKA